MEIFLSIIDMKILFKIVFLISGVLLSGTGAMGQIFQIQAPGIREIPPGHNPNTHFAFQFKIKNISGSSYTGSIIAMVEVEGGGTRMIDSSYVTQNGSGNLYTIMVDSFVVDTPFFSYGRNGIVVWVVDDNFNPISDSDSTDLYVTNQPSFLLGESGLREFHSVVDTAEYYDFGLRVVNAFSEDYVDTLYLHLLTDEAYYKLPTLGPVRVRANKHKNFSIEDFKYPAPPFWRGINPMRLWVDGVGQAPSLDTIDVEVELINGPEKLPPSSPPAGFAVRNPTNGPIVITTPSDLEVLGLELYDTAGRKVLVRTGGDLVNLAELPQFTDGLFWLNIYLSDGSQQQSKLLFVR